jgi:hypothetical protein
MKEVDVEFLKQLVNSLERASEKLEEFHSAGDILNFNRTKRLMLEINDRISQV